jgi:hypothetical protein
MGVKNLWTVLSSVGELTDLRELQVTVETIIVKGFNCSSKPTRNSNDTILKITCLSKHRNVYSFLISSTDFQLVSLA